MLSESAIKYYESVWDIAGRCMVMDERFIGSEPTKVNVAQFINNTFLLLAIGSLTINGFAG